MNKFWSHILALIVFLISIIAIVLIKWPEDNVPASIRILAIMSISGSVIYIIIYLIGIAPNLTNYLNDHFPFTYHICRIGESNNIEVLRKRLKYLFFYNIKQVYNRTFSHSDSIEQINSSTMTIIEDYKKHKEERKAYIINDIKRPFTSRLKQNTLIKKV